MAGRKKHTLSILEYTGKKHLTKKEKLQRRDEEVKIPDGRIRCPIWIVRNADAYKKWREVFPLLMKSEALKPTDVGALARYCRAHADYLDEIRLRDEVAAMEPFTEPEEDHALDVMGERIGKREAAKLWEKITFILSAQAVLSFDKAINAKMASILSLEDRLGLNIIARAKVVVPKKEEQPDKEPDAFGTV